MLQLLKLLAAAAAISPLLIGASANALPPVQTLSQAKALLLQADEEKPSAVGNANAVSPTSRLHNTDDVAGETMLTGIPHWVNEQIVFQISIERRIIIRIPRQALSASSLARTPVRPVEYKEKKIGKCLYMERIRAVQQAGESSLDLITDDNHRIRAYLADKCMARDFYSGFYLEKSGDGKFCADRETLHARTGTKCEVDKFRLLLIK